MVVQCSLLYVYWLCYDGGRLLVDLCLLCISLSRCFEMQWP